MTAGFPSPVAPEVLPVLPALEPLLPSRGLPEGSVAAVDGAGSLAMTLLAGASQAGAWCAVAGVPEFGVAAAAGMGVDPGRTMLVPDVADRWMDVAAALLDGCELVLLRPPPRVTHGERRRLETVAQRTGSVLVVAGQWDGAPVRLSARYGEWEGIGDGYGRVKARRAQVTAAGRGQLTRPRSAWLWLPGPDGQVTAASEPDSYRFAPSFEASAARD